MRDVRDIMDSSPASVRPDAPVEEIVALLREHGLPGVPVVDDEGRCVGIVTEADLVLPDDEGDLHLPHYINLFGGTVFVEPLGRYEQRLRKAFASTAEDMMTRDPDTVGPDTSTKKAAVLIHETGHNRLPVVEDGRLVGVVTRLDVLGALAK
jgi:CBS domain-containing protein